MSIKAPSISSASGAELRSRTTVSYTNLPNKEMFQLLFEHGCKDLSSQIHLDECSENSLTGGGYGDIYKGKTRDGTDIAIKVMRRSSSVDPKSVKRAMWEVHRWSKVNHPNLHELMGVIDFRGQLGMVSLWMEHGDLRSFILKNPGVDRYPWCIQVAAGVSYLHTNEMIHGDLKAMNILVSKDLTVRISDFDCSVVSDCSLLFSATGQAISLRWAAPELMDSSEEEATVEKTRHSDVYALGMTLLEIATGEPPYSEYRFDVGVMKAIVVGKPPRRPVTLQEDNRKDSFWSLLLQCWAPDRAARPSAPRILTRLQFETDPPNFKVVGPVRPYMSLQDTFEWLLRCGCVDLSSQMELGQQGDMVAAQGGFGDIWLGNLKDGTKVAIKAWRTFQVEQLGYKYHKRVTREIYLWSRLVHPNIQQFIGVIVFRDHQLGMVSRWMENGNLHEYMRNSPGFDRYQTCIHLTSAIAYMHHHGVIHGDLKGRNFLMSPEGVAKLASSSLANVSRSNLIFSGTTMLGSGTLRWMAPELFGEDAGKSKPAEVYALGMTILEVFSGKVPYHDTRNDSAVVLKIMRGILPNRPVDRLGNDERSNKVWQLMVSCWDRDPAARPTAAEVLESLNTISSMPA